MNKMALAILLALTPAALYVVFALFNPLPSVSAQYVTTVNGFADGIVSPLKGLFANPAVVATAAGTASGVVVNYLKNKTKEVALGQAAQVTQQVESENKGLYKTLGMSEQKALDLKKEADKLPALEEKVETQRLTIQQYEEQMQRKRWEDAGREKQDTDAVAEKVYEKMRKK